MTLPSAPGPASFVSIRTLPRARAEAERDPVERAVARHLGALACRRSSFSPTASCPQTKRRFAFSPTTSSTTVLKTRVLRRVGGQVLLPHLRLRAVLDDDQRAPVERAALGALHGGDEDRPVEHRAGRDVHERAAGEAGLVARDEGVLVGDDRAEVPLDQLRRARRPRAPATSPSRPPAGPPARRRSSRRPASARTAPRAPGTAPRRAPRHPRRPRSPAHRPPGRAPRCR